ncbi:lysylphosphatidylglycerol synthase transmembrane domain-containing protein [Dokdonia sinensis]|uniref:lysylphosphatidylglycerol synthase transmembrane domain-containing protein n=1 Tax=Dokdonia sinensis TaxID=2479847 RepID=UPI001F2B7D42|nr:lysylphosphatidylglycerol synthase transmembrane domain-containing protein [Dokdonia sinensis]
MANKKHIGLALKIILPLVGVFLMWYSLNEMSAARRLEMWEAIKGVNPLWVVISLFFATCSHLSRAYRWKFMLEPMGYSPRLWNSFSAVMIAYFANTFILRSGEILRGVVISKSEKIPFEKAFGSIISERIADLAVLLVIMTTAIVLQSTTLIDYFKTAANPLPSIIGLAVLLTIGILGLRILKKSSHPFIIKVRDFGLGILEGVKSILNMKKNAAFIFHTLFIWTMYIAMFWVMKFTVPGLEEAPLGVILAAFVVGAFSMSATNAGMGIYPIAMGAIFSFFGFLYEDAFTFGWIIWGTQTIFNIIVGGICGLFFVLAQRKV